MRSFFGAELVEQMPEAKRAEMTPTAKSDDFLEINRDLFKLENITLTKSDLKEGSSTQSVKYQQIQHDIPVYGAQLVVGLSKSDGSYVSAINKLDYEIPESLGPDNIKLNEDDILNSVKKRFKDRFKGIKIEKPHLFIYRHILPESVQTPYEAPKIRDEMLHMGTGVVDRVYLVWQVLMDTKDPEGNWELLVDASDGEIIAVHDRRFYATVKGNVFWPNPITSSQNENLTWNSEESLLNSELKEVDLENLDEPQGGKYRLSGSWVKNTDIEPPHFQPPETTGDFKYNSKDRKFLNVMAYYYLDSLIRLLRSFGIPEYNNAVTGSINIDPQGFSGADNSHFVTPISGVPYIAYGEGGVPDASDPAVIVHEYGHAIHYFLLGSTHQNSSYEEGFNDFLAACWLDRFNTHQFQREEVFPWDNNKNIHWDPTRRVDLKERFDDPNFSNYRFYFKGDILATALWDIYLNIGGNSPDENVRLGAANEIINTYLEMLVLVQDNKPPEHLANGLIEIDKVRTGGRYKEVILDAFRRRGLWP